MRLYEEAMRSTLALCVVYKCRCIDMTSFKHHVCSWSHELKLDRRHRREQQLELQPLLGRCTLLERENITARVAR